MKQLPKVHSKITICTLSGFPIPAHTAGMEAPPDNELSDTVYKEPFYLVMRYGNAANQNPASYPNRIVSKTSQEDSGI